MGGGGSHSNIAVGMNVGGRLEVFIINDPGNCWHSWQQSPGAGLWSGWAELGSGLTGSPTVIANKDGRLEVFARASDNTIAHAWQLATGGWSQWANLGGGTHNDVAVAMNADGRLEIFVVNDPGNCWHNWQQSPGAGLWSGWAELASGLTGRPVVLRNQDGCLDLFAMAAPNLSGVEHYRQVAPNAGWSGVDYVSAPALATEIFDVNANGSPLGARHPRGDVPAELTRPNGNRIVTLHGWLLGFGDPATATHNPMGGLNKADPDWHIWFAPDTDYLVNELDVNLGTFVKLGDILSFGLAREGGPTDPAPWVTMARPAIHVELDGWVPRNGPGRIPPGGWVEIPSPNEPVWWAFDPRTDPASGAPWETLFQTGMPYVEIIGSLVTDQPHYTQPGTGPIGQIWAGNENPYDIDNVARWTEIHSPDGIRTIPQPNGLSLASLQGMALCSNDTGVERRYSGVVWSFGAGTYPVGTRPTVDEFVGAESDLGTLTTGNPQRTGADIQMTVDGAGTLNVSLSAGVTAQPGRPGRFKAVYRLHWG
jgi:hypothetical protein